jgi:hypothetical protein
MMIVVGQIVRGPVLFVAVSAVAYRHGFAVFADGLSWADGRCRRLLLGDGCDRPVGWLGCSRAASSYR